MRFNALDDKLKKVLLRNVDNLYKLTRAALFFYVSSNNSA